jgi:hypothetical protein
MRNIVTSITIFLIFNFVNAQECKYLGIDNEFKEGEIAYLFGNDVRLRIEPSSDSETLTLLKIGQRIEIVKKTDIKNNFNGIKTPWYKVKYDQKIGYVLGGLISLAEIKSDNLRCFISLEKTEGKLYILTRVLSDFTDNYFENRSESFADNNGFCLKLFDNKGLEGINNILYINYLPESGGANSGGYYLFFDNKKLHKVIDLTSRSDIGFWESENLYFPKDSLGEKNKIIYIKEKGQYSESYSEQNEPNWEKSSKIIRRLEWYNNELKPNPETFKSEETGNND